VASFLVQFEGPPLRIAARRKLEEADLPIMLESGAAWEGDQIEMTSHTLKVEAPDADAAEVRVREALPEYPFGPFETQPFPAEVTA
jgi:hypothetical protein